MDAWTKAKIALHALNLVTGLARKAIGEADMEGLRIFPCEPNAERMGTFLRRLEDGLNALLKDMGVDQ